MKKIKFLLVVLLVLLAMSPIFAKRISESKTVLSKAEFNAVEIAAHSLAKSMESYKYSDWTELLNEFKKYTWSGGPYTRDEAKVIVERFELLKHMSTDQREIVVTPYFLGVALDYIEYGIEQ